MKNKEKFAKEIVDAVTSGGYGFCFDKSSGEIRRCDELSSCNECLFCEPHSVDECDKVKKEWAESEYIEKPVISKRDRAFLEYLHKSFKSIARNENGTICAFTGSAKKSEVRGVFVYNDFDRNISNLFFIDLPMVKWEDDKPWLIEDLKKLEVVEDYEQRNTFQSEKHI